MWTKQVFYFGVVADCGPENGGFCCRQIYNTARNTVYQVPVYSTVSHRHTECHNWLCSTVTMILVIYKAKAFQRHFVCRGNIIVNVKRVVITIQSFTLIKASY